MNEAVSRKEICHGGAGDLAGQLLRRASLRKGLPVEMRREEPFRQREQCVQRPSVWDNLAGGGLERMSSQAGVQGARGSPGQEEAEEEACQGQEAHVESPDPYGKPLAALKQVGDGNAVAVGVWAVSALLSIHSREPAQSGSQCSVNEKFPQVFHSWRGCSEVCVPQQSDWPRSPLPPDHSFGIFAGMLFQRI